MEKLKIGVYSEIDNLEAVILHTPGPEIENMIPENAERALYSDILNLNIALNEYHQLSKVLGKLTKTFEVKELLIDVLKIQSSRDELFGKIMANEKLESQTVNQLMDLSPENLATLLIEGVKMEKNTLTKFLDKDRYALRPLHNFFFTRDASASIYDHVMINKMASNVRERESQIMESIFKYHPNFESTVINPADKLGNSSQVRIEGGDILVASDDIILIGVGARTNSYGVDYILECIKERKVNRHIIVQELPYKPESFIHLDMVFTFLDKNHCMVYEPIILKSNRYLTIHIHIENGKVQKIKEVKDIPTILNQLGMDVKPLFCGGRGDTYIQDREQWHSGANFFAVGPGKVMGYARNQYTIEELNKNGYEVLKANDIIKNKIDPNQFEKYVITIEGDELSRGGGGCRCMTMPIKRNC